MIRVAHGQLVAQLGSHALAIGAHLRHGGLALVFGGLGLTLGLGRCSHRGTVVPRCHPSAEDGRTQRGHQHADEQAHLQGAHEAAPLLVPSREPSREPSAWSSAAVRVSPKVNAPAVSTRSPALATGSTKAIKA